LLLGLVVALLAVLDSISSVLIASYRLTTVPDVLQGRVSSVYHLILFGSLTAGQLIIGHILDHWGILTTLSLLWTGLLLFALFALLAPSVRRASFPLESI
jgi:hypothetical protein